MVDGLTLPPADRDKLYDLIVVGGGSAGFAAAMETARAGVDTLVIEREDIDETDGAVKCIRCCPEVQDWPEGGKPVDPRVTKGKCFNLDVLPETEVTSIKTVGHLRVVGTKGENEYRAKAILLSPGSRHRRLNVPGEEDLIGVDIHHCAACEGPAYAGQEIVVVGSGDFGIEQTLALATYASRVTVLEIREKTRTLWPVNKGRVGPTAAAGTGCGAARGRRYALPSPPQVGRQVEVGDVIAFRTPRGIDGSVSRLLHRVVAVDDTRDRFTTKGDANQEPDPFKVGLESLVGEATGFKVPYAGYVTLFLQSRLGLTWLAIIALVSFYPTLTRLAAWARRTAHRALTQAVGLKTEQLDRVAAGVNENREVLQELSSSIAGGLEAGQLHRMAAGVNENRETLQELSSSINKYVKGLHIHSETPDEFSEISESLARSSGGQTREIEDFIEPGEREAPLRGEERSA